MKNNSFVVGIVLLVALVGLFVMVSAPTNDLSGQASKAVRSSGPSIACTETDAGDDPNVKGYHTGQYPWGGQTNQVPDRCRLMNNQPVASCTNCKLMEYYCRADGYLYWNFYSGVDCSDGALVTSSSPTLVEYLAGTVSGEIRFTNVDGTQVEIPLSADQSYQSGEADDEPAFLGDDAPSNVVANQDELLYLRGEVCEGDVDVTSCVGAMFITADSNGVHLFRISDVDTVDNEIDVDDLTYFGSYDDIPYTDGSASNILLPSFGTVTLTVDEAGNTISFGANVAGDGDSFGIENGVTGTIVNTNPKNQIYEPWLFDFPGGTSNFEVSAHYNDDVVDQIEVTYVADTPSGDFTSSDGIGWNPVSPAGFFEFETWYGILFTYDQVDQQTLVIETP
jgi:hypothetical protein